MYGLRTKRDLLLEGTERPIIELVVNEGSELLLAYLHPATGDQRQAD